MNESTKATLAAIEALLANDISSPHDALLAAYRLGKFDGMIEMATVSESQLSELLKKAA